MDMAKMYLTDKIVQQELEETSSVSELDDDSLDVEDESVRGEDTKSRAKSIWQSLGGSKPNIVELEMLLEAYFTQMEGTLSILSTLKEYVDDTEDYINIMFG
ncbi:Magnesium transporter MRS2-F [Asimina triloba]